MKKSLLILLLGLLVAAAAFAGFYYRGTRGSRDMLAQPQPELAWLKKEFHLTDAEFDRVVRLHEAYLPQCARRCQLIDAQNERLHDLLQNAPTVTPEIEAILKERALTRATCEAEMLKHFVAVSRTMPPEQGRRYLAWVEQQASLSGPGMEQRHHMNSSQSANPGEYP